MKKINTPLTEKQLLDLKGTGVLVYWDILSDFIDDELKPCWISVDEALGENSSFAEIMQVGDFYMREAN